jgi:hypothetical protein
LRYQSDDLVTVDLAAGALAEDLLSDALEAVAPVELGEDELASPAIFFLLPDLKSVSYQPPPLRRKPAADICFFNVGLLQAGQSTRAASLIFCKTSSMCSQASHRYS